jgi:transposase
MQITTIGLDLAKHWFQVHGVDANGRVVVRRRLWRSGVIAYFGSLDSRPLHLGPSCSVT